MRPKSEFDIVVYGASGFTGRLVAEHLAKRCGSAPSAGIAWAMAGRSAEKLAQTRDEIGAPPDTPLLVADAADPASLQAMAARTQAVLTTVGPYQLYGSDLVAACASSGTDYLDLCGEPAWIAQMISDHQAQARSTGARIIHSCGFDSIPFELGAAYVQELALARLGHVVPHVRGRVLDMRGGISGGSAASGRATMNAIQNNPGLISVLSDPFALTPGFRGPPQPLGDNAYWDRDLEREVEPFVMATINTKTVHRSNLLLGHPYGEDFTYEEMAVVAADTPFPLSAFGPAGPQPGEGPDRSAREAGFFDLVFIGTDGDGSQVWGSVHGDRDPGYGSTSKIIAETAIFLIGDSPNVPGGFWTPGAAMGSRLRDHLQDFAGLRFTDATP